MCGLKPAFGAEDGVGIVRVHPEIARIRPHVARDKTRRVKGRGVAVFDGGNVAGFDPQLALNIQKRFAERCAFAAHDVTQAQFKIVKALWPFLNDILRLLWGFTPNHTRCPLRPNFLHVACVHVPNGIRPCFYYDYANTPQGLLHGFRALSAEVGTIQRTVRPKFVHSTNKMINLFRAVYR